MRIRRFFAGGVARNLWTLCRIAGAVAVVLALLAVPYRMTRRGPILPDAAKPSYTIWKTQLQGFANSNVYAVNNRGEAVGLAWNDEKGPFYPFLWRDGKAEDLGCPNGAKQCLAVALNDKGEMAGAALMSDNSIVGVVWRGTRVAATFGIKGMAVFPSGINNSGQVVGSYGKPECGSPSTAFVWSDGKMSDLGAFDALAINAAGEVAGYRVLEGEKAGIDPLIFRPGKGASPLPMPKQYPLGIAFSISDGGRCAGFVGEWEAGPKAALWDKNSLLLPSRYPSLAYGVNDKGQAVGVVARNNRSEAVLWDGGREIFLNETISGGRDWDLLGALSINKSGQIAGVGLASGHFFGYVLTPKSQ